MALALVAACKVDVGSTDSASDGASEAGSSSSSSSTTGTTSGEPTTSGTTEVMSGSGPGLSSSSSPSSSSSSSGGGVCGDGVLDPGEACDDSNMVDGDGCSASCADEKCGDGVVDPGEACDDANQVDDDACSNTCVLAVCGDGIVQGGVGEVCDDGNMVATDACTDLCVPSACGDGIVQDGVEACDDGNMDNADACTVMCQAPACGDGFVQAGEKCDDGDMDDANQCSNACVLNPMARRVFITVAQFEGNLGGVAGADMKCQMAATAANLGGTWKAWLSEGTPQSAPAMRFPNKSMFGYVLVTGTKIADTWADLVDGSLDAPIDRHETGAAADANVEDEVWTNTLPDGTTKGNANHCNGWSMNTNPPRGAKGGWTFTDAMWSDTANNSGCDGNQRLYCFEQ